MWRGQAHFRCQSSLTLFHRLYRYIMATVDDPPDTPELLQAQKDLFHALIPESAHLIDSREYLRVWDLCYTDQNRGDDGVRREKKLSGVEYRNVRRYRAYKILDEKYLATKKDYEAALDTDTGSIQVDKNTTCTELSDTAGSRRCPWLS